MLDNSLGATISCVNDKFQTGNSISCCVSVGVYGDLARCWSVCSLVAQHLDRSMSSQAYLHASELHELG
jgi:hypothetical protein